MDMKQMPPAARWMLYIFFGLCTLLLALDFILTREIYHPFERMPVFYALFGFIGCVVLVVVAKWMRVFLMRGETYYDDELKSGRQRDVDA